MDTGPLVALGKAGMFPILEKMPLRFVCPTAVQAEYEFGLQQGHQQPPFPSWLVVTPISRRPIATHLDPGEAEVIQLALELGNCAACLDDAKGRRFAATQCLTVSGSLGMLGLAKSQGFIPEVRPFVARLSQAGTWYDPTLLAKFLTSLGE